MKLKYSEFSKGFFWLDTYEKFQSSITTACYYYGVTLWNNVFLCFLFVCLHFSLSVMSLTVYRELAQYSWCSRNSFPTVSPYPTTPSMILFHFPGFYNYARLCTLTSEYSELGASVYLREHVIFVYLGLCNFYSFLSAVWVSAPK